MKHLLIVEFAADFVGANLFFNFAPSFQQIAFYAAYPKSASAYCPRKAFGAYNNQAHDANNEEFKKADIEHGLRLLGFGFGLVRLGFGFLLVGHSFHFLGMLLFFRFFVCHGFFKAFDGAAEIAAERFQSFCSEQQQHYDEDNKKLPNADSANAHGYTFLFAVWGSDGFK